MTIFVDTREQKPLGFPLANAITVKRTLNVGDYTTQKLEGSFVIERKSPGDLYGTILSGHSRFRREINRAAAAGIILVVFVECTRKAFINKEYAGAERHEYPGVTLGKIIKTISSRYDIEFVWFQNRTKMVKGVLERLNKEEKKMNRKGKKYVTSNS